MSSSGDNNGDLERLRKQVLERRSVSFVPTEKLLPLHDYCRGLKAEYMEAEQYLDARDATEVMEACKTELGARDVQTAREEREKNPKDHETRRSLQEWDQKISQHDEKTRKKLESLEKKHSQEMEAFEKEWREVMPDRYRRPSKLLMTTREAAHTLAYAGKFEEAEVRKNEAIALEQRELEEAQKRLNTDYSVAKAKLQEKQRAEVAQMEKTASEQRELLCSKRKGVEQAHQNRLMVLKTMPIPQKQKVGTQGLQSREPGVRRSQKRTDERLPPLQPPNQEQEQKQEKQRSGKQSSPPPQESKKKRKESSDSSSKSSESESDSGKDEKKKKRSHRSHREEPKEEPREEQEEAPAEEKKSHREHRERKHREKKEEE